MNQSRDHRPALLVIFLGLTFYAYGIFNNLVLKTYDAYTHIFLASFFSHKQSFAELSSWNPYWYGGFDQLSYPSLAHHLIALLANFLSWEMAFNASFFLSLLLLFWGVFRFLKVWLKNDQSALEVTALAVSLTSIAQAVFWFGQYPTIFSLAFLLHGIASLMTWLKAGRKRDLLMSALAFSAVVASHHLTLVFGGLFFILPSVFLSYWESSYKKGTLKRIWTAAALISIFVLIFLSPFIEYLMSNPVSQVPIPHASRESFLENTDAGMMFFIIPYSFLFLLIPFGIWASLTSTPFIVMVYMWCFCLLMGLGGTIPVGRVLLRQLFDVLTLDRFTFWATVLCLPLIGRWWRLRGRKTRLFLMFGALIMTSTITLAWLKNLKFQPDIVDLAPIVEFLKTDNRGENYRFLTLGFGSQMGMIPVLTGASSIDGNYHAARPLVELRQSGIEALDTSRYFNLQGVDTLRKTLAKADAYHLRYVFSREKSYDPILWDSEYKKILALNTGINIFEREAVTPLSKTTQDRTTIAPEHARWIIFIWKYNYILLAVMLLVLVGSFTIRRPRND